jgi:N-acyl-D-aspartate/D-glutamate deacylase
VSCRDFIPEPHLSIRERSDQDVASNQQEVETMLDLVVRAGTVVDGTGSQPFTADIGVSDGRVVEVGRLSEQARQEIDADGLMVTPGFVDIHTHFDGQATWDPILAPSAWHGITSVAMGNCGVGFAPARRDRHEWLIGLMEGVEDIPGSALAEGLSWEWETFPQYMEALEETPRVLDVGVHVPHAALRAFVMGDRGADPVEPPDDNELSRMADLLAESIAAGALGLGSSRTEAHRTRSGDAIGTLRAGRREMVALAAALRGTGAVLQLISDCYQSVDPAYVAAELDLMEAMAAASGRPLSFSVQQPPAAPERWRELQAWAAKCAADGLDIWTQVAPRPIGVILGLTASVNPFIGCPSYAAVAHVDLPERVRALSDPVQRARIIKEHATMVAGLPDDSVGRLVMGGFDLMFRLADPVDYDIRPDYSLAADAARAGVDVSGLVYDALLEEGGHRLLYLPLFNFVNGNLGAVREMIESDRSLFGLSDGGAHCGAICDASFTTSYLTLWARDRDDRLPVERVVSRITSATARHVGWHDRGTLLPGMLADLNVLDFEALGCAPPRIVGDLPAGGNRLLQRAYGYRYTVKGGEITFVEGDHTGQLPGGLLRGAQPGPRS